IREGIRASDAGHRPEHRRPASARLRQRDAAVDPARTPTAVPVHAERLAGDRAHPRGGRADRRSHAPGAVHREQQARDRDMSAVRTAVIVVGALGYHHSRIQRELPGSNLVGVHDSNSGRLAEVGTKLDVATFPKASELLDQVDACVIAVPTQAHEGAALEALTRGVHVLIEKPIAPSIDAADRILAAAAGADAIVQIGQVERLNGAVRACEPWLDDPLFVESHRLAPFNPRGTDVAVVLDLMIHDLDLVLSIMKRPVVSLA